jgi:F0F1-type ATP synthase membrane subunit c/vacuolar-type H+-ATPase subunit K
MILLNDFLHYIPIALVVAINSLAVGIGEGLASLAAIKAEDIQPSAMQEIRKAAILGPALIETSAVIGIVTSMLLLIGESNSISHYSNLSLLGVALAICISGFAVGLASSLPAYQACLAIARQPFYSRKVINIMLLSQSIIQTPIIFAFIISIFIKNQAAYSTDLSDSLRLIASGLCIGLGSVGPAIGMGLFAKTACNSIGVNRDSYRKILSFTFISDAIIETPVIFSLLISLLLITLPIKSKSPLLMGFSMICAAIATGVGTFAPGLSSGRTASAACKQIALDLKKYSMLSKTSMLAQGLIDTCAIYTLIISLMLIFLK